MFVTHKHFAVLILPVLLLPKLTNFWTVILHEIGVWLFSETTASYSLLSFNGQQ